MHQAILCGRLKSAYGWASDLHPISILLFATFPHLALLGAW